MRTYDFQTSNAFAERFEIAPYASGALDGLCFAVKDNIDVRDRFTSYGINPAEIYVDYAA
jgi:amidase